MNTTRCYTLLICIGLLSGCGETNTTDLQQFVVDARNQHKTTLPPIPQPADYQPFIYQVSGERDPFFPDLSIKTNRTANPSQKGGINPNLQRKREPLEKFPLDSLKMVGTITLEKTHWALIQTGDNTLYKAKTGQYLGENMGRITRISSEKIELTETIPDGLGGWMKRHATLLLSK